MMTRPTLGRRLVLEAATRVADGAGGHATVWAPLGTVWADIAPGAPREVRAPGVTAAIAALRVTLRGAPVGSPQRPSPGQRFREGARLYAITGVAEADPFGRFLLCHAHEETAL